MRAPFCIALLLAASACASAPPRPDPDAAFRSIQLEEANIERASRAAEQCDREAVSAADACASADRLCATARELGDADALTRCERARNRAAGLRAELERRCVSTPAQAAGAAP